MGMNLNSDDYGLFDLLADLLGCTKEEVEKAYNEFEEKEEKRAAKKPAYEAPKSTTVSVKPNNVTSTDPKKEYEYKVDYPKHTDPIKTEDVDNTVKDVIYRDGYYMPLFHAGNVILDKGIKIPFAGKADNGTFRAGVTEKQLLEVLHERFLVTGKETLADMISRIKDLL